MKRALLALLLAPFLTGCMTYPQDAAKAPSPRLWRVEVGSGPGRKTYLATTVYPYDGGCEFRVNDYAGRSYDAKGSPVSVHEIDLNGCKFPTP